MKRFLVGILALLVVTTAAIADVGIRYAPLGYFQITDLSAAVGIGCPAASTSALIRTETQSVRWRDDGTDPTSSVGQLMLAADAPFLYTGALSKIKFIQATSSAKLNVVCYR